MNAPSDKGLRGGTCNRRACDRPGATFYNRYTCAFYCPDCAEKINRAFPKTERIGLDGPLCVEAKFAMSFWQD